MGCVAGGAAATGRNSCAEVITGFDGRPEANLRDAIRKSERTSLEPGSLALLDDVALLAKSVAVSLDDVPAQIAKAGVKSAGVVIDDAAVTPRYVVGVAAQRELAVWGASPGVRSRTRS